MDKLREIFDKCDRWCIDKFDIDLVLILMFLGAFVILNFVIY
jgi:hypothetical protein